MGRARRVRDLEGDAGDARGAVVEPRRADRGDRHHQPARDDRGLGSTHRPAPPPSDRVAGPADGRALRRAARRRAPRSRAVAHGPGARPLLLRDEARVDHPIGIGRHDRRRRVRHGRLVDHLEPHGWRGARHRPVERKPHDALRHRRARLVRRAARPLLGASLDAARSATFEWHGRRDGRRHRRGGGPPDHVALPATSKQRSSGKPASRPG